MSFGHGKDGYFGIGDVSVPATADDISDFCSSVGVPRSADFADTTNFGDASKRKLAGLKDATISMEGPWDPTLDTRMHGILGLDGVAFEWGPVGNTGGYVKLSGVGILVGYEASGDVGDAVGWTAEFEISGDVTVGTF